MDAVSQLNYQLAVVLPAADLIQQLEKEINEAKKLKKKTASKRNFSALKAKWKHHKREAARLKRMMLDLKKLHNIGDNVSDSDSEEESQ